jgi:hypothetical protein
MPSGAEKWFNFLKNFNKIIDQKVIKDEKEKQLEWVDGVVKSVLGNFKGNPIALRLNLQDMLKTNVALTKSIDVSTLICPEDVEAEMNDLSKSVRSMYMSNIQGALASLRTEAMDIVTKITALLYKLSDAAMFQVSTQGFTHKLVGAAKDSTEVVLGLSMTGPVVCGNSAALRIWVQRVFQALRAILAHFLTGKSFNEKLFTEYGSCIAMAGLHSSDAAIVALIAEIRLAAAVSPVSLDERDITSQLTAFDEAFMTQYAVRTALELCAQFEPHRILKNALLCELDFDAAALWEAEVAVATVPAVLGEVSEEGIAAEKIRLTQIYPAPPAVVEEQEWDAAQAAGMPEEFSQGV